MVIFFMNNKPCIKKTHVLKIVCIKHHTVWGNLDTGEDYDLYTGGRTSANVCKPRSSDDCWALRSCCFVPSLNGPCLVNEFSDVAICIHTAVCSKSLSAGRIDILCGKNTIIESIMVSLVLGIMGNTCPGMGRLPAWGFHQGPCRAPRGPGGLTRAGAQDPGQGS